MTDKKAYRQISSWQVRPATKTLIQIPTKGASKSMFIKTWTWKRFIFNTQDIKKTKKSLKQKNYVM